MNHHRDPVGFIRHASSLVHRMGKECFTGWEIGRLIHIEKFRDDPAVSAAIDDKAGVYLRSIPLFVNYGRYRVGAIEFYCCYRGFIVHRHTHFFNRAGECLIEICTGNLPCPGPSLCKLVGKLVVTDLTVFDKFGSSFLLKMFFFNCIQKTRFFEGLHTTG